MYSLRDKFNYIKYLDLLNSNLRLEISYDSKRDIFLFPIDTRTSRQFETIFNTKPFKEIKGSEYEYFFGGLYVDVSKSIKEFFFYVEIRLGKMRKKMKFNCTEKFYKEISWILDVESYDDLYKYLKHYSFN